jgi:hypothetical protein
VMVLCAIFLCSGAAYDLSLFDCTDLFLQTLMCMLQGSPRDICLKRYFQVFFELFKDFLQKCQIHSHIII